MRIVWILLLAATVGFTTDSFKSQQKKFERVKSAYLEKEILLKKNVLEGGFSWPISNIFFRVFKEEKELEIWMRKSNGLYALFKTYTICSASGDPGPKRKEGDFQVPEGFYTIQRFNPNSKFHLSLGLNYPNSSDKILSDKTSPGGDIFIHGSCVSIGCMAMTDDYIKEIYLLAVESKNAGKSIPVHVFPCKLHSKRYDELKLEYPHYISFWKQLEKGFDYFEKNKKLPQMDVQANGNYFLVP